MKTSHLIILAAVVPLAVGSIPAVAQDISKTDAINDALNDAVWYGQKGSSSPRGHFSVNVLTDAEIVVTNTRDYPNNSAMVWMRFYPGDIDAEQSLTACRETNVMSGRPLQLLFVCRPSAKDGATDCVEIDHRGRGSQYVDGRTSDQAEVVIRDGRKLRSVVCTGFENLLAQRPSGSRYLAKKDPETAPVNEVGPGSEEVVDEEEPQGGQRPPWPPPEESAKPEIPWGTPTPGHQPSSDANVVELEGERGGTYRVPVTINGVLNIKLMLDSGASDVFISPDVALTLIRTETLTEADFLDERMYRIANGDVVVSQTVRIRQIAVGSQILRNVTAGINENIGAPMLLGQSALSKLGRVTIDYENGQLIIEP